MRRSTSECAATCVRAFVCLSVSPKPRFCIVHVIMSNKCYDAASGRFDPSLRGPRIGLVVS